MTLYDQSLREIAQRFRDKAKSTEQVEVVDYEVPPDWFHSYQSRAWHLAQAIVAICAGWQSGKTVFLPAWLRREIQRKGPGDYGAFSTTYKLLSRKFLPELKREFKGIAEYRTSDMQFLLTEEGSLGMWGDKWDGSPTVIQLGYAENPDSLESATMKAVVWDEPGQRSVPEQAFLTVQSRLMVNRGRMALASRPYEFGWYQRLVEAGLAGEEKNVGVVSFPSWANPVNPQEDDEYWVDLRRKLPPWLFIMLYEGRFTRPAGLIYDTLDYELDTVTDFDIPADWKIYPGVDFGNVNMAGGVLAEDPKSQSLYVISEYLAGKARTIAENVTSIRESAKGNAPNHGFQAGAGGSHQEEGWREACRRHGFSIEEPPVNDVEVQIQCVYGVLATHQLKIFRSCTGLIGQLQTYSRELNEDNQPTEKIANKAAFHHCDWFRYIVSMLRPPTRIVVSTNPISIAPSNSAAAAYRPF